jgi:hypothetical protein
MFKLLTMANMDVNKLDILALCMRNVEYRSKTLYT